ncbi:uncharacterized protein LOC129600034 [Paramacrobiotus metropolitanus]|uniref:uncharacterized protein LOC129600034 n=1 Tax=Paramacrobiotus metropolitanus TaxID=2943436 RepID=UPI0024464207|nr:uncharacterized protein LOC129600034 [Paramacrobiotus metropolitanus]
MNAVFSFPTGSAAGVFGLRPQHLKDLLNRKDDQQSDLCVALTDLTNLVLKTDIPEDIRPFFFGANLIPLGKKDGGVRPIAVGETLRRLVSKIASNRIRLPREQEHQRGSDTNLSSFREGGEKENSSDSATTEPSRLYTENQIHTAYLACRAVYFCTWILCTVGNGLNLVVILRSVSTWRTSACHYVIGTAVADLVALWCGLFEFLPWEDIGNSLDSARFFTDILRWFGNAGMSLSDWILVVFSWERLFVIVDPFRFGFLQRVLAARIVIALLVMLSLACYVLEIVGGYIWWFTDCEVFNASEWLSAWYEINRRALIAVKLLIFLLILLISVIQTTNPDCLPCAATTIGIWGNAPQPASLQ